MGDPRKEFAAAMRWFVVFGLAVACLLEVVLALQYARVHRNTGASVSNAERGAVEDPRPEMIAYRDEMEQYGTALRARFGALLGMNTALLLILAVLARRSRPLVPAGTSARRRW